MPPLEQTPTTVVLPTTMVQTSPQESAKSLVAPGGGAPPSSLNRLDPEVGGTVLTPFGLAKVLQVRSKGIIKCQLKSSSKGTKALCILNDTSYQVLSQSPMNTMSSVELAQYALRLQSLALTEAKVHHHGRALQLYERVLAVSSQLLQQRSSMPSSQRGDWVIRTVKSSIEAAKIAIHLHRYPAALDYTKDALGVIDALERKRTSSATETSGTTSSPSSPPRKTGSTKDEETSVTSSDNSSVTSSASSSSSTGEVQDLGCVKLFGECRVKALLLTAQSLLEMNSGKTLAYAALRLLDQAQTILRKYSTKAYLENPDFKSTMKAFVSLQKELKKLKKQAKLIIKPKATTVPQEPPSPGRLASFFRLRRVVFADDNNKSGTPSSPLPLVPTVATKAMAAVVSAASESTSTWTRRDTLVLGGVVAGGLVAFHCVMRRHRV